MIPARLIGWLALAVIVLILVVFGPAACNKILSQGQQARVDKGQAKAGIDSGEVSIGTVSKNADNAAGIDKTVKENTNEIWNATAGDSNDAADRATCRLRVYYNAERCAALRKASAP